VSVVTAAVDVADENALRAFLDHYENEGWPAIRGVVHAAGVAGLCPLVELSASALDADLRGKAVGALLLDRLLGDLDFCVYYSSLSSILASPLLGGYAAANSFLDALAHDRRARGKRALSLNWGFWAEGGMASRHTAEQGRRAMPRGMDEFSPEQALSIQGRLLREDASQVMIGVVDWTEYGASYPAAAALPLFDELLRGPEAAANAKPQAVRETHASKPLASGEKPKLSRAVLLGEVPEARLQRVVEFLGAEVARVLRIPVWKMETHVPLSNLGIDSMMATELKNGIEASIGVVLPLVRFLKGPTVHDLAGDIMSSLPSEPELTPAASRVQAVPSLVVRPPPLEIENGSEEPEGLGDLARAEDLLRRIDHLSDDEVSLLLEQMLEGGAECA
jgi:acyl carrier protein